MGALWYIYRGGGGGIMIQVYMGHYDMGIEEGIYDSYRWGYYDTGIDGGIMIQR